MLKGNTLWRIFQEDLINNVGIGAAYKKMQRAFDINERGTVDAYQQVREVTDKEYQDVVKRFHREKNSQLK